MICLSTISLEHLNMPVHVEKLRSDILAAGCIGIKLTQWYISHTQAQDDRRNAKLVAIFHDIFDQCPYHSLEYSKAVFEKDFEIEMEKLFDMNIFVPIASGSIGQVYHTRMKDTQLDVVVKIKHPHVDKNVASYIPCLKVIKYLQKYRYMRNWLKLYFDIEDFISNVNLQIDFNNEVANSRVFAANFEGNPMIIVPQVYMHTSNVIVSKYEPGVQLEELTDYQRYKALLNLICFIEQTVIIDDFIHGDLHIKNWKFRHEAGKTKLVLYDCGICYSSGDHELNRGLWTSFIESDSHQLTAIINKMLLGNITPAIQANIDEFCRFTCENFKTARLDFSFIMEKLMILLCDNQITLNKTCLNMIITMTVLDHVFKQNNILSFKDENDLLPLCEIVHQQRMELINFCNVYETYENLKKYLKEKCKNKSINRC